MKNGKLALAVTLLACAVAVALVLGAATGSARTHKQSKVFKVAWIYVGPHNDAGWSQAHDVGRLYVQKKLGSKVQTTYKQNIALGPQLKQTVAGLVRDGYSMIFGTSYGYFDKKLAAKYPSVKFEQATGTQTAKNLSEYFGAAEDTIFLSGMAAGAATKKGILGYVVAYPIPEVIRHANAFALGAQLMHPGAKEKKAAESLVSAGADVLGQNVDSPATGTFAESKHIPWVGYDSNAKRYAPKSWLTASVYNWGPYYLRRVKAAMNGTWKSGFYYGSIKDGFTTLAPYGPKVSKTTKAAIAKKMKTIKNGSFYEFTGPLYDQPLRHELARPGRDRQPQGLTNGGRRRPDRVRPEGRRRRPSASSRADAGDHQAVPRRRRERRSRFRGGRRRGARAARRERRRQEHALQHPDRALPARRGRDLPLRAAGRVPRAARCARGGDRHGPPALPARRAVHRRGERRPRRPPRRGPRVPASPPRNRAARRRALEAVRARRRAARPDLAALARRAAARRDPEGALPRGARPHPRRADRRPHAAGGRGALRDAARDGRRRPDGDLHLAQAARGEGGCRPRHRPARRADDRDRGRGRGDAALARRAHGRARACRRRRGGCRPYARPRRPRARERVGGRRPRRRGGGGGLARGARRGDRRRRRCGRDRPARARGSRRGDPPADRGRGPRRREDAAPRRSARGDRRRGRLRAGGPARDGRRPEHQHLLQLPP